MAKLCLSTILPMLFEKLTSPELLEFATQGGVRSKLSKWEKLLKIIKALLNDAEQKQLEDEAVKIWLEELRDLTYDAKDILDEYATEALRRKLKIEEHQATTSRARKLIPACFISRTPSALWSDISVRSKIDDITSRLQDLCKQRTELGLVEIAGGRSTASFQGPPTTSFCVEPAVCGRDEDKAKMLELVLRDEPDGANFGVIPIVGMGGIGKTTLAREVYNDVAVKDFSPKAWVCISDDFDVTRISKSILECITSNPCVNEELNIVQNLLRDALNGKKFLIVLDDVWSERDDSWEILKAPFVAGAPGSKIIVTTRINGVASAMRARECYHLKHLSDDECWAMFVNHAFDVRGIRTDWNLNIIRKQVLQKCGGLPLALKILGGLLCHKETEDEWMNILNSEIWDLLSRSIFQLSSSNTSKVGMHDLLRDLVVSMDRFNSQKGDSGIGDDDDNGGDDDNNGGGGGKNNKKGNQDDGDGNGDKDKRGHDHGGGEMKGKNMNFMGEAMFGFRFGYHAGNENGYPIGQLRCIREVQPLKSKSLFHCEVMIS